MSIAAPKHHHHHYHHHHHHRLVPGPTMRGVSSIVVDAKSGRVLEARGANIRRYPASLTKLMTLDLAFRALRAHHLRLNTRLPVSRHAAGVSPVKLYLKPGHSLTVRQAILAMTTMSANDAATALGEYLGHGSEWRFARMMTARARALGMRHTVFRNASGLPNAAQVTTARDLSKLTRDIILHYPQYQHFFECKSFVFNSRTIRSNNQMLRLYHGTIGMKTGYTDLARHNLITAARRHGRVLIGVVLHEPSWGASYHHMTAMLDDGFRRSGRRPAPARAEVASSGGSLLFPSAAAEPLPPPSRRVAAHRFPHWAAQVGSFRHYANARDQVRKVRRVRGGTGRILKFHTHGRTIWAARITGITRRSARRTCGMLAARHQSCFVIAPR